MNPDLLNLIALQDLELKIADLQKQIQQIPAKIQKNQEILEQLKQSHHDRAVRAQELSKQRRAHEGDVDLMRAKLSKYKDQLMTVKTNKEYTAMLHEIKMAEDQIRLEEDKILEVMEGLETLELELAEALKALNAKSGELQEEIRQCEASKPLLEAAVSKMVEEKTTMQVRIEAGLLARYRRIADARKGIALAEAIDELCSACHVRIRPQVYADLLRTETIFTCDSCSRLLFSRGAPN